MTDAAAKPDRTTRVAAGLVVLLAALALWWTWTAHGRAVAAERRLGTAERNWRVLTLAEPLPTAEVAAAWRERREALEQQLEDGRRQLGAGRRNPVEQAGAPTQRAEAFFAIAQFGEAQRTRAREAGVTVPESYAFGFSAYANSGPADEELGIVHRQLRVTEALLGLVWRSGARELTRVQREVPASKLSADSGGAARTARREGRPEDYLEVPAARSLARGGLVQTLAVRIGFIGKTATLRWVLNQLGDLPLPLVVRAVEVEPLGADGAARGGVRTLADLFGADEADAAAAAGNGDEASAVPIIAANDAEFLITVEYLDFTRTEETATAAATTEEAVP